MLTLLSLPDDDRHGSDTEPPTRTRSPHRASLAHVRPSRRRRASRPRSASRGGRSPRRAARSRCARHLLEPVHLRTRRGPEYPDHGARMIRLRQVGGRPRHVRREHASITTFSQATSPAPPPGTCPATPRQSTMSPPTRTPGFVRDRRETIDRCGRARAPIRRARPTAVARTARAEDRKPTPHRYRAAFSM